MNNEWTVVTYGDIILSDGESELLSKRPEYALYGLLDKKNILHELEMGLCKARWDRRSNGYKVPKEPLTEKEQAK